MGEKKPNKDELSTLNMPLSANMGAGIENKNSTLGAGTANKGFSNNNNKHPSPKK